MISNGMKSSVRFLIRISVSVLALEEYNTLQQRYALETQCRVEAEKYAADFNLALKLQGDKDVQPA